MRTKSISSSPGRKHNNKSGSDPVSPLRHHPLSGKAWHEMKKKNPVHFSVNGALSFVSLMVATPRLIVFFPHPHSCMPITDRSRLFNRVGINFFPLPEAINPCTGRNSTWDATLIPGCFPTEANQRACVARQGNAALARLLVDKVNQHQKENARMRQAFSDLTVCVV